MSNKKAALLIIVTVASTLLLYSTVSLLLENYNIIHLPSVGNIKTIGLEVYVDEQLKNRSDDLIWGTVYPGSIVSITRYVRSVSNLEINLSMTLDNWQYHNSSGIVPNDTAYVYVKWDAEGESLKPHQSTKVVFTLEVSPSSDFIQFVVERHAESFDFDIRLAPLE